MFIKLSSCTIAASTALLSLSCMLSTTSVGQQAAVPRHAALPQLSARAGHYPREAWRSLSSHGVSMHYSSVSDLSKSPMASHGSHSWFGRQSIDLSMDVDAGTLIGLKGASAHLDLKQHGEAFGRMYEGVSQGYSNIDAHGRTALYELWILQSLSSNRVEIQVGKIDANTRFAFVATAADFLNSSMGYSPTIMEFPTYPDPRPGANIALNLPASARVSAGIFQTMSGKMALGEIGKRWTGTPRLASGRLSVGYWNLRAPITDQDGSHVPGTSGCYAVIEQTLWQSSAQEGSGAPRQLAAFLQIGTGNAREDSYTSHIGMGLVEQAPFARRPSDSIGIAATRLQSAADPDDRLHSAAEFVVEGYYKLALSHTTALVTDAQFFHQPGGFGHAAPYLVVTPRLVVSF